MPKKNLTPHPFRAILSIEIQFLSIEILKEDAPMPSSNKKTFVYRTPSSKRIIEGRLKDRISVTKDTESALIEAALYHILMPKNGRASDWIELMYDGDGLAAAYSYAFAHLSTIIKKSGVAETASALLSNFAFEIASNPYRITGHETELDHLVLELEAINEKLPSDDPYHDYVLCPRMLKQLRSTPTDVWAADISNLIFRNIELLKDNHHAYSAMADIASIVAPRFPDTPRTREQFVQLLIDLSDNW
jgi:hypothetical protein